MPLTIQHFSDVLCVWATVAHIRVQQLEEDFGDRVEFVWHTLSLFGDTEQKIGQGWAKRGGWEAYADHVASVVDRFDHVHLHPDTWRVTRPRSSAPAHALLVGARVLEERGEVPVHTEARLAWRIRRAFFEEGLDVAQRQVLNALAGEFDISIDALDALRASGELQARLSRDDGLRASMGIEGSPTMVLDGGRQKLYGNVGYRVMQANVVELLDGDGGGHASWC